MEITNLDDLLKVKLQKLYSVESQIIDALPLMEQNATSENLRQAISDHLEVTKKQRERLEEIAQNNNISLEEMEERGITAILDEGQELVDMIPDPEIKDTEILSSAEKVEHYEMAAYEGAKNVAKKLNYNNIADNLDTTLREEKITAEKLKAMATGGLMGKIADVI